MPAKYGSVLRCSAQKDPSALKRNVNLYIISQDPQGKLAKTNATIKTNLKTWLDNYRMINDTIDILDPFIINIDVSSVLDVEKVMITNKTGANYSAVEFDINKNMSPDGGYIVVPKNAILELKYPEADVKGKVK